MNKKNVEAIYMLSPMQESMLFQSLFAPGAGDYIQQMRFSLTGPLDVKALERAWQRTISRHAVLRTAFVWEKLENPMQVVQKQVKVPFECLDWRRTDERDLAERFDRLLAEDRALGFSLTKTPLMRVTLVQTADDTHHLLWTHHHILLDGWSLPLVMGDVFRFYQMELDGSDSMPSEPPPYRRYINWLKQQNREKARGFWGEALGDFRAPTPLGVDHPAGGRPNQTVAHWRVGFDHALVVKLNELARANGLTANLLFMAGWSLLLGCYADTRDVLFGVTVSGRPPILPGVDTMVGLFINTLPIRVRIPEQGGLIEWLTDLRRQQGEMLDHDYAALTEIQAQSGVRAGTPLFESLFVFENYQVGDNLTQGPGGLTLGDFDFQEKTGVPLNMTVIPGEAFSLRISYDPARFEGTVIRAMAAQYLNLLNQITAFPHKSPADISPLNAESFGAVLALGEGAEGEFGATRPIHHLFEQQAQTHPGRTALVFGDERLTYGALNARANQLAHYLLRRGARPESFIGVQMERSFELVVALLGILKAGCAYVPLDPDHPEERRIFTREDAGLDIVLTQSRLIEHIPAFGGVLSALDEPPADFDSDQTHNPALSISPARAMYAIYTSGSTGRPKGVVNNHAALFNRLQWMQRFFQLKADDRVLQKTPFSFDVSVWEFFWPLITGAEMVIAKPEGHKDAAYLRELIQENRVTTVHFVPSMLDAFLEAPAEGDCPQLRQVICSGEALTGAQRDHCRRKLSAGLFNLYGPTEAAIDVTCFTCTASDTHANVPIGEPIANTRIYLTDSRLYPVPVRVPGELLIGGVGLARGYLHRADLTAAAFVPDPFSGLPGERLYKTGDRCRFQFNGPPIEFLDRIDHQVKLRGFRIELGEIEAALRTQPTIQQAAVCLRTDAPGGPALVAFISLTDQGAAFDPALLQAALAETLPTYMTPSQFITLAGLPLSANGKIDRAALNAMPLGDGSETSFSPPRDANESVIAGMWADLLGLDGVGVHANFFEMGGHSLLATRLASRINQAFGRNFDLRSLFEAPTVAGQARLIAEGRDKDAAEILPPITATAGDGGVYPLSFAQRRLWFLQQLEPENAAYNLPMVLNLEGRLDLPALESAFALLLERRQILRTIYLEGEDGPYQKVLPPVKFELKPEHAAGKEQAKHLVQAFAARPFDLAAQAPIRVLLVRLKADHHIAALSLHHIASDGWSNQLLIAELADLYKAFATGRTPDLKPATIQYGDYAQWQAANFQDGLLTRQLDYWRDHLAGAINGQTLIPDKPRPPKQTFRGRVLTGDVSSALTEKLKGLARKQDVTLFMLLLAAFQTLLHRYSDRDRISVGTPISGRNRSELEGLIGVFINTLVMHTDLAGKAGKGAPRFTELLARVRETALDAYANQDIPFEMLVDKLQPERDLSVTPLFQVLFILQPPRDFSRRTSELAITPAPVETGTAMFDVTLSIEENASGLHLWLQYNLDLFHDATMRGLLGHFQTLLAGIVEQPKARLWSLPLLNENDLRMLQFERNQTDASFPSEQAIHQWFRREASSRPQQKALTFENQSWTYAELDQRSDQICAALQHRGVRPETTVGLLCRRSPEMLAGLLAILKAGGTYIPMDPGFPKERLAYMLENSGAALVLCQRDTVVSVQAKEKIVLEEIDGQAQPADVTVDDIELAYIIYTSGSTGQPKGVQITRRAVVNFLNAMSARIGMGHEDSLLAVTSLSFDIAVLELLLPLVSGGRIILVDRETTADGAALAARITQEQPTLMQATPATWQMLIDADWSGDPNLKILCGGEALPRGLAHALMKRGGGLINLYGPTETTIWSAAFNLSGDGFAEPVAPIGTPIANTRIYLLDRYGDLVPHGVPGMTAIGGEGLARGYHNRPDLTAAAFTPDPFSGKSGARIYHTGDLARYRPENDGTNDAPLLFLGRRDHQVKLRGFRIELGEIEALLESHESVNKAVAMVRGKKLVAYLTTQDGFDAKRLRAFIAEKLPPYTRPNTIVPLDAFPLTPNGKIDRRALPDPPEEHTGVFSAPVSETEQILAGLWAHALGLERVGADADFFALGGHSLPATRLLSSIRRTFRVELPLTKLFEAPTPRGFAPFIETARSEAVGLKVEPIQRVPRDQPAPLSFAQRRMWFIDQMEPGNHVYNIPAPVQIDGPMDITAMVRTLNGIIKRQESLRTTFEIQAGEPVQIIHADLAPAMPLIDLSGLPEPVRSRISQRIIDAEGRLPFNLEQGPLIRIHFLRLAGEQHAVLLTMHHIISDGWSAGVLVGEMTEGYEAVINDTDTALDPLSIQYADFAVWQRGRLSGETFERQISFWREMLADCDPILKLPLDRPHQAVQTYNGSSLPIAIDQNLTERINALCRTEGVTQFMLLLAVFELLLHRYSGQKRFAVGTPIAGRNRAEVEPLVGFFVNILVMPADFSQDISFGGLLTAVREKALAAQDNQDLPFEQLVDALQPERDLSRPPLFQVLFDLRTAPVPELRQSYWRFTPLPVAMESAKFDLTFAAVNTEPSLTANLEYNTDLFDGETIAAMGRHFLNLLDAALSRPETRCSELAILDEDERARLLRSLSQTETDYPRHFRLHHLVENRAASNPEAKAVVFNDEVLTYADLNRRANQLAHHLQDQGVGPETTVGVCLRRSPDLVVSLLAILKAGGAYVPFVPDSPQERLAFMLQDAMAEIMITESDVLDLLPAYQLNFINTLVLDEEEAARADQPIENPSASVEANHPAYMIYTSGSTGNPKGVVITHAGVTNYLHWCLETYDLQAGQGAPVHTSIGFDATVTSLWGPLVAGRTVVLVAEENEIAALGETLAGESLFSLVKLTPSHLDLLRDLPRQEGKTLRTRSFVIGGEALPAAGLETWRRLAPEAVLYNEYGPTETVVGSCVYRLPAHGVTSPAVPIGKPIANTRLYVVDPNLRPVPRGVVGGLCIAGAGLARGYHQRPELTAERFTPDPFSGQNGERLYHTGDLVRQLADGNLTFIGRIDNQVKIRAHRVELGEIEAVLAGHPAVAETAVTLREDKPGDKRLVAYLTSAGNANPSGGELQTFLKQRLPEYMVPAVFELLERMPLTANGKIDRRALPVPQYSRSDMVTYVAPATPLEEKLAKICAEVLAIEKAGMSDNFFDLGGHSLGAIRFATTLKEAFQVEVTLQQIFETPVLSSLAADIQKRLDSDQMDNTTTTPITALGVEDQLGELEALSDEEARALLEMELSGDEF